MIDQTANPRLNPPPQPQVSLARTGKPVAGGCGVVYAIKDWNTIFEDRRSREVQELLFVKFPVRRHGETFRLLIQTREGVAAYGIFCTLVTLAATCPQRGTLTDSKGPWTPERFARHFHAPQKLVSEAFTLLSSQSVGWLTADCAPTECRPTADEPPPLCTIPKKTKEPKKTKPKKGDAADATPPLADWPGVFSSAWSASHDGAKYPWSGAKDGAAMGRIRKHFADDIDAFRPILARYLADGDLFTAKQGHTVAFLASRLASYLTESPMRHAGSNGTTSGLLREDFDGCLPGETTAQALIRKGKL